MSVSDEFVYITMGEISGLFDIAKQLYYANDTQFYNTMQNQILLLGKEKGFFVAMNYRVKICSKDTKSKIDVVWRTKDNIFATFKIDSFFNRSSVESLCSISSFFKFWLYYGEPEVPHCKEIVNDFKIHIIRKNR